MPGLLGVPAIRQEIDSAFGYDGPAIFAQKAGHISGIGGLGEDQAAYLLFAQSSADCLDSIRYNLLVHSR